MLVYRTLVNLLWPLYLFHYYLDPIATSRRQSNLRNPLSSLPVLYSVLLTQPHNRIARFRQRKLLSNTNPRSTIKREVSPARSEILSRIPSFRPEDVSVRSIDRSKTMHAVSRVCDESTARNEKRRGAVGTAAQGDSRVFFGVAGVDRNDRVKTKCCCEVLIFSPLYNRRLAYIR
jgi:hypothetical protein